ncbi:MAG: hypothetical protein IMZ55_07825, partial [Acidobacteria bacterium]|nr:hypothetical protein [Acidobacteriota bacterium]
MATRAVRAASAAVVGVLVMTLGVTLASGAPDGSDSSASLRVGAISIEIFDVFDASVGGAWNPLFRAGNLLHARTREGVVRRELLFQTGDGFDPEVLRQTERNLRALGLFRRVSVEALPPELGVVPIRVRVHDAWSLTTGASYRREGGFASYDLRFREGNLGGLGLGVAMRHAVNFDRRESALSLTDARVFGTRERLAAAYAARSDGVNREVSLSRPFFTLATISGHDLAWRNAHERFRTFEEGQVRHEYDLHAVDGTAGWMSRIGQAGPGSVWRLGAGYRFIAREYALTPWSRPDDALGMPASRRWGGPFVVLQFLQHRYEKRSDLLAPDRDVDLNLGLVATADVFVSSPRTGPATASRVIAAASVERGWRLPGNSLAAAAGRIMTEAGGHLPARGEVSGTLRAWWPHSPTHVTALFAEGHAWLNPDRGVFEYLGGTPGLRGFRENQFAGTRSLIIIAEQRKYFGWRPAGVFQPGVVAFAEIGAIGGGVRLPGSRPIHADLGVGLRIVHLRAARL